MSKLWLKNTLWLLVWWTETSWGTSQDMSASDGVTVDVFGWAPYCVETQSAVGWQRCCLRW